MKISQDAVREQASRMLAVGFLKSSPKQRRLFDYLLEESLAGRGSALLQESIAQDVLRLKRGPGGDAVRVLAGRLRKTLREYYARVGLDDPVVIMMPTGRYALHFEEGADYRAKKRSSHQNDEKPSVAVLEFRGIGLKTPWTNFPSLLAEELSTLLVGIGDFRIIGPLYRNELGNAPSVPIHLTQHHFAAEFIVDGSLALVGRRHVLRVRLIEGNTGGQIWAKRYALSDDMIEIADFESDLIRELAHEIGALFGVCNARLSELARVKTGRISVFEAVLTARLFLSEFTTDSYHRGLKALRQAIKAAPEEALPRASLSLLYAGAWNESFCMDAKPAEEIDREARRAYALDPRNSQSQLAMLCAAAIHRRNEEFASLASAMGADPGTTKINLGLAGIWLIYLKIDIPLGVSYLSAAMENNPHYPRFWHLPLAIASLASNDEEGALAEIGRFLPRPYWAVHMVLAVVAARRGEERKARNEWNRLLRLFPDFPSRGYHQCGRSWHRDHALMIAESLRGCGLPMEISDEPARATSPYRKRPPTQRIR